MRDQATVRGRKFAQVIEGARRVFLRHGFEGASVDEIAREADVSKATLYSYFPDKRMMFIEVFRSELSGSTFDAALRLDFDTPIETALTTAAEIIVDHIVSPEGVRMFRISVGESERFPSLAREYLESGPLIARALVERLLAWAVERGEMEIEDRALAADQFLGLCGATIHDRAVFIGLDSVDNALRRRAIQGAVRMMIAAYGTDSA